MGGSELPVGTPSFSNNSVQSSKQFYHEGHAPIYRLPEEVSISQYDIPAPDYDCPASISIPKQIAPVLQAISKPSNGPKGYKTKRTLKVIVVGDAGVGKTCLSYRFCCRKFPEQTSATIGVDFRERCCVVDDELLRIQLWDTAGQERYRQIVPHYYRNVKAVVFVYDVTNKSSFDSLKSWIAECEKYNLTDSNIPRVLIGNKNDISVNCKVSWELAQAFALKNNMALFEISAKSDPEDYVESIFLALVVKLQQAIQKEELNQPKKCDKVNLKANTVLQNEGWCC